MALLEHITVGTSIKGIVGSDTVTVIAVKWYGTAVLEITYKDSKGGLASQLLYRENEDQIEILDNRLPWSFDADGNALRLVSEAYRIQLAYIFDPYLAVHLSAIDPLPHQISAVYQEMLPKLPLRYILADDPGAGKTVMTGLLLKELMIRGDVKRCLIVTPGSLAEQWQDELYRKFNLRFEILTNDRYESAISSNIFTELNLCIARLDKLSRSEEIQKKLRMTDWDFIVCDEAHKMSATIWGGEIKYTKRFQLGRLLARITRHFLLLTATPHNGKDEDFQLFMTLIDQDRFEGAARTGNQAVDVSDVMRRLVKEELLKFDGTPLFPERLAYTVSYSLSPQETELYDAVTEYVREEFARADQLNNERKSTVGFALTVLQRRLASSPEAIYQSLRRRRERLEHRLAEERIGRHAPISPMAAQFLDDYDDDDLPSDEREEQEENVADQATAATTIRELEAEIKILKRLEHMAGVVRVSGQDRKWEQLSTLLQDGDRMFDADGRHEKLIIFTEHRDTLHYLSNKIRSLLGKEEAVVTIHGGVRRDERRKVEERFKQDKEVCVLIATDAAGEGINLQRAHLMINYDLPWNPNRLEQRFGRIHRIGQTDVCHLWNLVSIDTQEGKVFKKLFDKLEEERKALGGKVFDILGKVSFDNRPLRELLIDAIRYGDDPNVRAKLFQVVDHSLDRHALQALLTERALTEDVMDVHRITTIREEMERMEAHKLQPHFIEAFFLEAFRSFGGKVHARENGRYEITAVPLAIRNHDLLINTRESVLPRYERICFDKSYRNIQGLIVAELICPGHPLLEATIDLLRERHADLLKRGAVFVDERDDGTEARLLFYIEDAIQDGVILLNGNKRIISKKVHFVEMKEDGTAANAGYAPYLDYRAATPEEQRAVNDYIREQPWLQAGIEDRAQNYAIANLIPTHYAGVKARKHQIVDKIAKAVKERLTATIQFWDYRAAELKQKESTGKINARLNSQQAARRAEEMEARLHRRLGELEAEKMISATPPNVVGGALVIPHGLLNRLVGTESLSTSSPCGRQAVEAAAMRAVMELESYLGYIPRDVSSEKCGYDIESAVPLERRLGTSSLRFLEVKGRAKGATTVTVTKNEILTALNKPEEFILAIVEVDGNETSTVYLKRPFKSTPDFSATSVNYNISDLMETSEILLQN